MIYCLKYVKSKESEVIDRVLIYNMLYSYKALHVTLCTFCTIRHKDLIVSYYKIPDYRTYTPTVCSAPLANRTQKLQSLLTHTHVAASKFN